MNLTVNEAIEKQRALKKDIFDLLHKFEAETKCNVVNISIDRAEIKYANGYSENNLVNVSVEIHLPEFIIKHHTKGKQ